MKPSSTRPRFPGLQLSATDRRFLAAQTRAGRAVSARTWKRIRILELLHAAWSLADVAAALGTYPREVRRVGRSEEHTSELQSLAYLVCRLLLEKKKKKKKRNQMRTMRHAGY